MIKNQKGFTLIELVLVITILGILAVAALPQFIDVSTNAAQSSHQGVAGSVREGIALNRANDLVTNGPPGSYPATLDAAADGACSTANACFGTVLQQAVSDGSWSKAGFVYTYTNGAVSQAYTYDPAAGTFE